MQDITSNWDMPSNSDWKKITKPTKETSAEIEYKNVINNLRLTLKNYLTQGEPITGLSVHKLTKEHITQLTVYLEKLGYSVSLNPVSTEVFKFNLLGVPITPGIMTRIDTVLGIH